MIIGAHSALLWVRKLSPEPLSLVHCLGAMEHASFVQGLDLRERRRKRRQLRG